MTSSRRIPRSVYAIGAGATLLFLLGLPGCSAPEEITGCSDAQGIHPVCGFRNPEDIAPLADGRTLLVSQFSGMEGAEPGNLAVFDLESERLRVVFRGGAAPVGEPGWGDDDCPGPPPAEFAPHGIDLAPRPDGRLRLLVVNHGGRESIELFELTGAGAQTALAWRGCAIPPEGAFLNDVVALPDGGFLVTHMMDRDRQLLELLRGSLGSDTGVVYEWQSGGGFVAVEGTRGPFPNGIEVSPDGSEIYLNLYLASEVRRISRKTGETLAVAPVRQPDNSTWGRDGRLLVASHHAGLSEQAACQRNHGELCGFAFEIVALDPESLEAEVVLSHAGAPMGAATVAVDVGGELVMGSFTGDRVIRAPLPSP